MIHDNVIIIGVYLWICPLFEGDPAVDRMLAESLTVFKLCSQDYTDALISNYYVSLSCIIYHFIEMWLWS